MCVFGWERHVGDYEGGEQAEQDRVLCRFSL